MDRKEFSKIFKLPVSKKAVLKLQQQEENAKLSRFENLSDSSESEESSSEQSENDSESKQDGQLDSKVKTALQNARNFKLNILQRQGYTLQEAKKMCPSFKELEAFLDGEFVQPKKKKKHGGAGKQEEVIGGDYQGVGGGEEMGAQSEQSMLSATLFTVNDCSQSYFECREQFYKQKITDLNGEMKKLQKKYQALQDEVSVKEAHNIKQGQHIQALQKKDQKSKQQA